MQIRDDKLDWDVSSRIRSLENVKHKAGGGDKKIFDDKEYLRLQIIVTGDFCCQVEFWSLWTKQLEQLNLGHTGQRQ